MGYQIKLLDENHRVVATAFVEDKGSHYAGMVDLRSMPLPLRRIFEEYESLVSGQVLTLLDDVEDQISVLSLSAKFDDGHNVSVKDLQIFPRAGTISFKAAQESATPGARVLRN